MFTFIAIENLFKHKQFDEVILNHGIYVPQGIINEYARIKKINVSTWCTGYRRNFFVLHEVIKLNLSQISY